MRRWLVVIGSVLGMVLLPSHALAGGNWLDFREDPRAGTGTGPERGEGGNLGTWAVAHVGQALVAHTGIYVRNDRRMDVYVRGSYFAWLTTDSGDPSERGLPADAIRLSPFAVDPAGNAATVRARFVVPDVPSGEYEVLICDDPCTEPGFGQYVQGWLTVMQTPREARLFELAEERAWDARSAEQRARRLQRQVLELEVELDDAQLEARVAERAADARISSLQTQLVRAIDGDPAVPRNASWPLVLAWAIAIASLAGALIAVATRSPIRHDAFVVPDTVPDDLERLERVG